MQHLSKSRCWTDNYERWDAWQDPEDEATQRRQAEEKRLLKNFKETNMSCAHDRSAERKLMEMSIEDKIAACREFRHKGNLFHGEGQYRRAALQYRQALIYYDFCFPEKDSEQKELDEIRQACLLNSAACFLACQELDQTLDCCYQALREDPGNVKALYRRAVVHRIRDQFEEASADLAKALAQLPNDISLRKENAILKSKIASYRENRKVMGERIFRTRHQQQQQEEEEVGMGEEDARRKANVTLPLSREITEKSCETSTNSGEDLVQGARRGSGGGGLVFPTEASEARSWRSSEEEDQGRMRHDLFLPVCVDLSRVESIAGGAWPESRELEEEKCCK
ncbi:unnamed protein product [Ascophyllum nodosum]